MGLDMIEDILYTREANNVKDIPLTIRDKINLSVDFVQMCYMPYRFSNFERFFRQKKNK